MTSRTLRIGGILTAAIALTLPCRPGPIPKSTQISLTSSTNAMSTRKALPRPILQSRSKSTSQPASNRRKRTVLSGYGRLPLRFEVNQGQADPNVQFISRNRGYSVFLGSSDITLGCSPIFPKGERALNQGGFRDNVIRALPRANTRPAWYMCSFWIAIPT
jgi:hypothetical protein